MASSTLNYLKTSNRNFDNILDSYLNLKDGGTVVGTTTFTSIKKNVVTVIDNTTRGSALTEMIAESSSAYPAGCVIPVSCSGASQNIAITLPPADDSTYGAGTVFTIVGHGGSAAAANSTVLIQSASSLYGDMFTSSSTAAGGVGGQLIRSLNGDSSLTWAGTTWTKGTKIECLSDGQNWHISGHTAAVSASVAIA